MSNQAGPPGKSKAHFPILIRSCADLFIAVNKPPRIRPSVALSTKSPILLIFFLNIKLGESQVHMPLTDLFLVIMFQKMS